VALHDTKVISTLKKERKKERKKEIDLGFELAGL
jgi:hypothetical protein